MKFSLENPSILYIEKFMGKNLFLLCRLTLFKKPNSDLSQTSHCNIKGLSVSEVMRIENMITQVKFY